MSSSRHCGQILVDAGLLPHCDDPRSWSERFESYAGDLLPDLLHAWRVACHGQSKGNSLLGVKRLVPWLEQKQSQGALLTRGISSGRLERERYGLTDRLAWWPRGIPSRSLIGIVSSRLGRQLDQQHHWFRALRVACGSLDPARDLLVTSSRTTTAPYVTRCAQRLGLPRLRIELPRTETTKLTTWLRRIRTSEDQPESITEFTVWISPPVFGAIAGPGSKSRTSAPPPRDRAVIELSDRLLALKVRPRGNMDQLLRQRLAEPFAPEVRLAVGPTLVQPESAAPLVARGARLWTVPDPLWNRPRSIRSDSLVSQGRSMAFQSVNPGVRIGWHEVARLESAGWAFLTHCTRGQVGPWPDQEEAEYFDDLLFERPEADRSAWASLCRIVRQERLIASPRAIRGGYRVVSLTAVPLAELPSLRTFRSHRGRWDFEPYGLCIRRDWLERLGTRPVRYGDTSLWESLAPKHRPFFQQLFAGNDAKATAVAGHEIDWSTEQEWRHEGDIDLRHLPEDAGLLFVPSAEEARKLAVLSRWPVTMLDAARPRRPR